MNSFLYSIIITIYVNEKAKSIRPYFIHIHKGVKLMRTENLRYLIELSQHKTLTAAAEKLNLTPQALSIAIKTLEQEMNIKLLERSRSGAVITPAGKMVIDISKDFFSKIDELILVTPHMSDAKVKGSLKISLSNVGSENFMPVFVSLWYKAFPSVNLEIRYLNGQDLLQSIRDKQVDLALFYAIVDGNDFLYSWGEDLQYTTLYVSHRYCLVPKSFPLAEKKYLTIDDLKKETLIFNRPHPSQETFTSNLAKFHDNNQKTIYEPNHAIFKELIAEGIGIGIDIKTPFNDPKPADNIIFIPFKEAKQIHFGYLLHTKQPPTKLLTHFINYMEKYFRLSQQP